MILIHMLQILSSTEKYLGNEIETYILNDLFLILMILRKSIFHRE